MRGFWERHLWCSWDIHLNVLLKNLKLNHDHSLTIRQYNLQLCILYSEMRTFATTDKSQPKWQYFLHSLTSDNQNDNNGWRRIMYAVVGDGWRPSNRDWAVGWFSIVDAQMCFVFNVLHFLCTHCVRRLLKLIQRHYLYFGSDCVGKCQCRPNHLYVCCLICKLLFENIRGNFE